MARRVLATPDDLGSQVGHRRLRVRGELHLLVVELLLEHVLPRPLLRGPRQHRGGPRLRLAGLGVDQEEFLFHSDGTHVIRPFCARW